MRRRAKFSLLLVPREEWTAIAIVWAGNWQNVCVSTNGLVRASRGALQQTICAVLLLFYCLLCLVLLVDCFVVSEKLFFEWRYNILLVGSKGFRCYDTDDKVALRWVTWLLCVRSRDSVTSVTRIAAIKYPLELKQGKMDNFKF